MFFSLKQFVFQLFRDARAVLRYQLCSSFSLEKKFIVTLFYYFVDPRRLKKFMLMHCKSLFCFKRQFWVEKRRIQTVCCKPKLFSSKYIACKSSRRVRISILINRNYCSDFLYSVLGSVASRLRPTPSL